MTPDREAHLGEPARADLKEATLTGIRWVTVARVAAEVVALVTTVVVARLLPPAEFGQAALAMAVALFARGIVGEAFSTPLIQRKTLESGHLRSAALMSIACGAGLSALTFGLASPVGGPLFGERVADLIQLASPAFLIASLGVVPYGVLQRWLEFRRLSIAEIASLYAAAAVTLGLALLGVEAEALVLGLLAGTAVSTGLLVLWAPGVISPGWHPGPAKDIAGFGLSAAMSSALFTGTRNIDYAILSAKLSAAQVGFYWRAFQLGVEYQGKITRVMQTLSLPVFSRAASFEDMKSLRARIVRVHATAVFPLLFLYVALAPELVPWLFGERWEPTVVPSQILAVVGLTWTLGAGTAALLLAARHPHALLVNNVVSLIALGVVVFFTADHGLTAVCIGVAAFNVVGLLASYYVLVDRLLGIPIAQLGRDVLPALVGGVALFAVALPAVHLLSEASIGTFPLLLIVAVLALAAYLATLRAAFQEEWADLVLLARRVARRPRAEQEAARVPAGSGAT
jgi:lipopolysaccharide exporter